MTQIVDRFYQAVFMQTSTQDQYNLVKTVLDYYPPEKPLGQAALNVCYEFASGAPKFLTMLLDDNATKTQIRFAALAWDKDPACAETSDDVTRPAIQQTSLTPMPLNEEIIQSGYINDMETEIETLVDFCAYGMDLNTLLQSSGLHDMPHNTNPARHLRS